MIADEKIVREGERRENVPARPKDAVEAEANDRLCSSGYCEMRCVSCEYRKGVLVLCGKVSSYYMKQIAQSAVLGVRGVKTSDNQVKVDPQGGVARTDGE